MASRIIIALVCLATLAVPGVAFADPPTREVTTEAPAPVINTSCGFPVLIEAVGKTVRKTWYDDEGNPLRAIETYPGFKWILTSLAPGASGESITLTIPGPAFYTFNPDGSTTVVGTGPWGFGGGNPDTGEPGIFLVRGRIIFHADGDIEFVGGTIKAICPLLR